jgi:pantoate--beta-alanine ligase
MARRGHVTMETADLQILRHAREMQDAAVRLRAEGRTIGFVPTMGFLHDGHLSLMTEAARHTDVLVISIFVNPTQFGPNEDLGAYPRDLERDLELAGRVGVDVVYCPSPEEIYPAGYQTYVTLEHLPARLCGRSRPVHFRGVATVVTKLFNTVQPNVAVFGEKDFQQLAIIRRMVADLNFNVRIIGGPTVRETDGLAMSSRNAYLDSSQRPAALSLSRALYRARDRVAGGEHRARVLTRETAESIGHHPAAKIDYIEIVDPESLEPVDTISSEARMLLAVKIGSTRLIDNIALIPAPD